MVPMIVMGPHKAEQGALILDEVRQLGAMIEGEPLEVEMIARSTRWVTEGIPLTLSFSLPELSERKEFFSGIEKTYRVQWKPAAFEITEEDRARGYKEFPLTTVLTYRFKEQSYRLSRTVDLRVRLDTIRLRRRVDSKLDLMMGKIPKEISS
jgi:hypothetical protein